MEIALERIGRVLMIDPVAQTIPASSNLTVEFSETKLALISQRRRDQSNVPEKLR
jgi:hypothetical protein